MAVRLLGCWANGFVGLGGGFRPFPLDLGGGPNKGNGFLLASLLKTQKGFPEKTHPFG